MGYIARPFVCEHNHYRLSKVVIWAGTRKILLLYNIEYKILSRITPHLISFIDEDVNDDIVDICVTCGIIGCGIDLLDKDDESSGIIFNRVKNLSLPLKEFRALVNFTNTGYEIFDSKRYSS